MSIKTIADYMDNYHLKLIDIDLTGDMHVLPALWKCLYLRRFIEEDSDDDDADDADDDSTPKALMKQSLLFDADDEARIAKHEAVYKFMHPTGGGSSEGGEDGDEKKRGKEARAGAVHCLAVPAEEHEQWKEYVRANAAAGGGDDEVKEADDVYCYRVRRWKRGMGREREMEMEADDDMICIQNASCMSETAPTWHLWLDAMAMSTEDGSRTLLLRDSERFISIDLSGPLVRFDAAEAEAEAEGEGEVVESECCCIRNVNLSSDDDDDGELEFEDVLIIGQRRSRVMGMIGKKRKRMIGGGGQLLRLDVLAPALFRYNAQSAPVCNLGRGVKQSLWYTPDDERSYCKPRVRSSGITFDNMVRYLSIKAPPACVAGVNLVPLFDGSGGGSGGGGGDVWTLFLSFSHPIPSQFKRTVLYKKNSIELEINARQEMSTSSGGGSGDGEAPTFIDEQMAVRLHNSRTGDRMVNVSIALQADMKKAGDWIYTLEGGDNVEWLAMNYDNAHQLMVAKYPDQSVRIVLDGETRYWDKSPLLDPDDPDEASFDTGLLSASGESSSSLLLGHRQTSADAAPGKIFNGHMFDIALYPWVFSDFELENFTRHAREHIERYKIIGPEQDVFGEKF